MRKNKLNIYINVSFSIQNTGIEKKKNDDFTRPKTRYGE
jgi:uncharacterized metal-binding protein